MQDAQQERELSRDGVDRRVAHRQLSIAWTALGVVAAAPRRNAPCAATRDMDLHESVNVCAPERRAMAGGHASEV